MSGPVDWSRLTDKDRKDIGERTYDDYGKGDPVKTSPEKDGKLLGWAVDGTCDSSGSGGQVTVVANDRDASRATRVMVLYRGSSGLDSRKQDVRQDWLDNDVPEGFNILCGRERAGDVPQLCAASKELKSVMARFPNAKVDVYGHSLGSMAGQYALSDLSREQSKRINGAWLYEGPNIYSTLNATQKKRADSYARDGRVKNYVDLWDLVATFGNMGDDKTVGRRVLVKQSKEARKDAVQSSLDGMVNMLMRWPLLSGLGGVAGYLKHNFTKEHMWGGYQFDADGRIVAYTGKSSSQMFQIVDAGIDELGEVRGRFEKSGGGLSRGEQIWLDCGEANLMVKGMRLLAEQYRYEMFDLLDRSCGEAEATWQSMLRAAELVAPDLSSGEVLGALGNAGATEAYIRVRPEEKYEHDRVEFDRIVANLDDISGQIARASERIVKTDSDLAAQLQELSD
jgi:hypothetical protein